jgi:hypothetical protein
MLQEGQDGRDGSVFLGLSDRFPDQRLMSQMNAVKNTDGKNDGL